MILITHFGAHLVGGHVRAPAGAVDRKEAKAGDVQAVQVAVSVGHELAAFLGGSVGRHGEVYYVRL